MNQPKLFRYLQKFSKEDWRLFPRYLKTTFRDDHDAVHLYGLILSARSKLEKGTLEISDLQTKKLKNSTKKHVQNLMSLLSGVVEDYWVWSDLKEQNLRSDMLKVESLNRRNLYAQSDKYLNRLMTSTDTLSPWAGYYQAKASYATLFSNHPKRQGGAWFTDIMNKTTESLFGWHQNMVKWFLAEMYNMTRLFECDLDKSIEQLERQIFLTDNQQPFSDLVDEQYRICKDPNEEAKLIYQALIDDKISDPLTRTIFFARVRQGLLILYRQDDKEALKKLPQLLLWSIDKQVHVFNNEISPSAYISDLNVLTSLGMSKEVEKYKDQYLRYLPSELRSDYGTLSSMLITFAFGNFDRVIDIYSTTRIAKETLKIQANHLFLMASYELYGADTQYFEYHIINAKLLLKRNQKYLGARSRVGRMNFIKLFGSMTKGRYGKKEEDMLLGKEFVSQRKWFSQKMIRHQSVSA